MLSQILNHSKNTQTHTHDASSWSQHVLYDGQISLIFQFLVNIRSHYIYIFYDRKYDIEHKINSWLDEKRNQTRIGEFQETKQQKKHSRSLSKETEIVA